MSNNMKDPLEPSSVKSIIAALLLSLAIAMLFSQFATKSYTLRHPSKLSTKPLTQQAYAAEIPQQIAPQTAPEPTPEPPKVEVAPTPPPAPTPQPEPVKPKSAPRQAPALPAGSHTDWMAQAGIKASDFGYANSIIGRENGLWCPTRWNGQPNCPSVVTSYNPTGGSSAYGICQALPGSKMATAGADWATNPITQLRWCNSYAHARYGSWAAAHNFWNNNHWW